MYRDDGHTMPTNRAVRARPWGAVDEEAHVDKPFARSSRRYLALSISCTNGTKLKSLVRALASAQIDTNRCLPPPPPVFFHSKPAPRFGSAWTWVYRANYPSLIANLIWNFLIDFVYQFIIVLDASGRVLLYILLTKRVFIRKIVYTTIVHSSQNTRR